MIDFYDLTWSALRDLLQERCNMPPYRATQLFNWVYGKSLADLSLMTDIGREDREILRQIFTFPKAALRDRLISCDGTRKYLVEVEREDRVESVMIKQPRRMTLCVSSQVGCGMGCVFCRTGTMGFMRNLSTSEILRQVLAVIEDAKHFDDMFSNIVFMGMGEPLHNFNAVADAVRILTDHRGLNLAPRKITVSTVGLVPAIRKFAEQAVPANLAVSLNATSDEVRSKIMPVNKAFSLADLLGALRAYPLTGRKKITIEYVMLAGVNDTPADLRRLPKLLHGIPAKVNLIPYNENAGLGFIAPARDKVYAWHAELNRHGLNATVRWSKGADIAAACGQLATSSQRSSLSADSVIAVGA